MIGIRNKSEENLHEPTAPKRCAFPYDRIHRYRHRWQAGRDAAYATVGYYGPRTNLKKDKRFNTVGSGNLLSALVPRR